MSKTACRNSLFNGIFSTHCGKTMKKTILSFIQIQIMLISKTLQKEYIYKKPFTQWLEKRYIRIMGG